MIWGVALAFACGAAYDILNVRFMAAAGRQRPLAASVYSTALGGVGLTGVIEVIHDERAFAALLLGYFFGTYVAVKWP